MKKKDDDVDKKCSVVIIGPGRSNALSFLKTTFTQHDTSFILHTSAEL